MASLNAGPEYYAAEEKYRQAKTYEDKMAALLEMLKFCPKHKAAHTVLMEVKGRIADLRKEHAKEQRVKASKRGHGDYIKRQGDAQVVLMGFANAGKSALLNALCNLKTLSTDVPYETPAAVPGMIQFEGMDVQVLDLPSAQPANKGLLLSFSRNADLSVVILDPLQDLSLQREYFKDTARAWFVVSKKSFAPVKSDDLSYDVFTPESLSGFKRLLISKLDLIRIFTKSPRGEIDRKKPFVIHNGATVMEIARQIHKEFYQNLKFAKVWGSTRFAGQQVSPDYVLKDGDVVELHMK